MASVDAQIRIAIKNLGALTKLTKTLDKLNVTTNKIVEQLEKMEAPSQQLRENLTKADKEASKLASGSLHKVNRELKEIEKTSQRASFSFGGLLTKLGALRGSLNKGLGSLFGKNFLGGLESGAGLRGISDILNKLNKTSFSNLARSLSDATFSITALGGAFNVAKAALNFASPIAAAAGSFVTLERSAKNMTENIINSFRRMNTKIIGDSLQSFKQLGFLYDPRSALNMDIWKNFENMKGGGFASMKGMQSQGKTALEGMFAPKIGRTWYGQTTFPNAFGQKDLMSLFPAMQMGGFDVKTLTQYPGSLDLFPKEEGEYLKQLRENILLGKDINKENFRRKKVLEEVLRIENRIENQIRKNIALSKQSRQASGFKDWNAYIGRGGQALLSPVEKSIRRHGRKAGHGFTADQYGPQPLYGPALPPETPLANRMSRWNQWGFGKQANPQGMFASRQGLGGRARGALSSAMIGGGFPLLFGQSGLASVLGGLGGAVGGALGGGFGFGLSIVGTAAAQKIQETLDFRKAIQDLNTEMKGMGFSAGVSAQEIIKLGKSLGITKQEAVQVASQFKRFGPDATGLATFFQGDTAALTSTLQANDFQSTLNAIKEAKKDLTVEQEEALMISLRRQGVEETINQLIDIRKTKLLNEKFEKQKQSAMGTAQIPIFGPLLWQVFQRPGQNKDLENLNLETDNLIVKLNEIKDRTKNIDEIAEAAMRSVNAGLEKIEKQLTILSDPAYQVVQAANAIGDAFGESFRGIIRGTMSVQEAFANMFNRIADHFADMAAQMAANQIKLGLLKMFASAATASASSFNKVDFMSGGYSEASADIVGSGGFLEWNTDMPYTKKFSSGGYVTRPTVGLVGEAGESEYVIPASKMASSMQRYSAGARGASVVAGGGSSYAGGGAGGSTTVNYSGPILNFNSEEFVPRSAVGEIIATATARGAKAGEARTLSSLQNSRSRRSNIGL